VLYAPINVVGKKEREDFCEQLQTFVDKIPKKDLKLLMGDFNAKVGSDNTNRELIMGKHGTRTQNENREHFTEFCTPQNLVIRGTIFPHKTIHKTTWTLPDRGTVNQFDHFTIGSIRPPPTDPEVYYYTRKPFRANRSAFRSPSQSFRANRSPFRSPF
jgi:hypothetical protein